MIHLSRIVVGIAVIENCLYIVYIYQFEYMIIWIFPGTAFTNCANDPICSADSLQNYMVKYGQDCNRDEQEDCYDYNAIHYMGPFNCQADMPYNYASIFNKCIRRTLREEKRQQKQQQS